MTDEGYIFHVGFSCGWTTAGYCKAGYSKVIAKLLGYCKVIAKLIYKYIYIYIYIYI